MTRKIALGIFVIAILLFLMPWVSVSCMGEELLTASGFDMVRGSYREGEALKGLSSFNMNTDSLNEGEDMEMVPSDDFSVATTGEREPLAIWALATAAAGVIISLFAWRTGFILRIIAGLAGIGFMIALKFKIGNDISNDLMGQGEGLIQVKYQIGYWLTLAAFAAAAIVSVFKNNYSLKLVKEPEANEPVGPPPENAPQPPEDKPPPKSLV